MNTIFCPHCGYENASQNNFCVRCGTPLTKINDVVATSTEPDPVLIQETPLPIAQQTETIASAQTEETVIEETISITSEVSILPEPANAIALTEDGVAQDAIMFPPETTTYDEENIAVPQPTVAYSTPLTEENTITTSDVHRFVLENSDTYATEFEKLENGSIFSLNWAAALFGSYWFLYRKLYVWGGIMLAFQTAFLFIFGSGFFAIATAYRVFGLFFATPLYSSYVRKHLHYAKTLDEKPKQTYFKEKGSTSLAAVALGIFAVLTAFVMRLFWVLWF